MLSAMSMMPTQNSKLVATAGEIDTRKTITSTAATNSEAVCPSPHSAPISDERHNERSRPAMVQIATR